MAYYCLHKLHKWPHEFIELDVQEQAFVIAAIKIKLKNDKKKAQELKRGRK